jgi:hypothetical protein
MNKLSILQIEVYESFLVKMDALESRWLPFAHRPTLLSVNTGSSVVTKSFAKEQVTCAPYIPKKPGGVFAHLVHAAPVKSLWKFNGYARPRSALAGLIVVLGE